MLTKKNPRIIDPATGLEPVFMRYADNFKQSPPLFHWYGTDEQLDALMEQAIKSCVNLTAADLCKAQGMDPPIYGDDITY